MCYESYKYIDPRNKNIDQKALKEPKGLQLTGYIAEDNFAVPWATEGLPTKHGFVSLMRNEEYNTDGNSETSFFHNLRKRKKDKKAFLILEKAPDPIHESYSSMEECLLNIASLPNDEPIPTYLIMVEGAATITTHRLVGALGGMLLGYDHAKKRVFPAP